MHAIGTLWFQVWRRIADALQISAIERYGDEKLKNLVRLFNLSGSLSDYLSVAFILNLDIDI